MSVRLRGPIHSVVCFAAPVRALALLLAAGVIDAASAATITVNPGETIASGLAAAAPGDTVIVNSGLYTGGIVLDQSVTLQANGAVLVQPSTPATDEALSIRCSDCSITGFIFEDFGGGVSPDDTSRARVTIAGNLFRRGGAGFWISGDAWLVEGNEIDGLRLSQWAEDYGDVFGTNHIIRHNYFHGLRIPQDLGPGPNYKHHDCFQFWNNNGEVLHNILIEENIFTDFVQGVFLANETGVFSSMSNIVVRHNVFWGTSFVRDGNLLGVPSHGAFFGKAPIPGVIIENNLFRSIANCISLYTMLAASVEKNIIVDAGTAYTLSDGTAVSAVFRGTAGNLLWNNVWNGALPQGPDQYFNPQLQDSSSLIGPDGIPWTTDDGWRSLNPFAAGYGPQIGPGGPLPPPSWQDTDGDGYSDVAEILFGTNPNNPLSFPSLPISPAAVIALAASLAVAATRVIRGKTTRRPS
jgi:hypothetical protein